MERIKELINIYTSSAINLRKVADLAEAQNPASEIIAATSRSKAATYDLVIQDLKSLLGEGE